MRKREITLIRLAKYQQSFPKQRQGQLNTREFQVDDLVLRKNMGSMVDPTHGKFGANWERPYIVAGATGTGPTICEIKRAEIFQIHGCIQSEKVLPLLGFCEAIANGPYFC